MPVLLVAGQGGDVDRVPEPSDGRIGQSTRAARQRRDPSEVSQRFETDFLQQHWFF